MDCSWDYGNNACDGGEEWRAYQYVIDHKGLMTEEDYGPYTGQVNCFSLEVGVKPIFILSMASSSSYKRTKLSGSYRRC